jgi:hypothetical protein
LFLEEDPLIAEGADNNCGIIGSCAIISAALDAYQNEAKYADDRNFMFSHVQLAKEYQGTKEGVNRFD